MAFKSHAAGCSPGLESHLRIKRLHFGMSIASILHDDDSTGGWADSPYRGMAWKAVRETKSCKILVTQLHHDVEGPHFVYLVTHLAMKLGW